MSLVLTITDAGRAALVNANHTGTLPLIISHIAIGSGRYNTNKQQTALQNEIKRLTTFGGGAVASDVIHVTIQDNSSDTYSLGEFGLITSDGVLFAVCSQEEEFILEKNTYGILLLSADTKVTTIDVSQLEFAGTNFLLPPGTTLVAGVLKLADTPTALAGINNNEAMTPLTTKAVIEQHKNEESAHGWGQIEGKPATFPAAAHSHSWNQIESKPAAFPPAAHSHGWNDVQNKPDTFPPSGHSHSANDLPSASLTQRGITQLTSSVNSTSTTMAATPAAVKTVNDALASLSNSLFSAATRKSLTVTTSVQVTAGTFYYWTLGKFAFFWMHLNVAFVGGNSPSLMVVPSADRPPQDTTITVHAGKDSSGAVGVISLRFSQFGAVYLEGEYEYESQGGFNKSFCGTWRIA